MLIRRADAALVAKHRNPITVGTEEIHFALRLRAEQAREAAEAAEALKAEAADHAEQGLEAAVESLVI